MSHVAIVLGLLVAATYGTADFLGGLATKRAPVAIVVVGSQLCSLPLLAVLIVVAGGEPTAKVLGLGAAAGAVGGIGLTCLYRGLASGQMSVVAPITAVGAAIVPFAWGVGNGERPSRLAMAGVVLAIIAVVLISRHDGRDTASDPQSSSDDSGGREVPVIALAVVAGAAFGGVFVLLAETGDDAGFWPLVTGRFMSIALLTLGALATGRAAIGRKWGDSRTGEVGEHPENGAFTLPLATIAGAGAFDISANAVYLLAARRGLLALVAMLSSLYPAATVGLARIVLHERLEKVQIGGLALAAAGVTMIAAA